MAETERARNRARERLGALVEAGLDPDDARLAAIEALRGGVGFERWCWPLTDPGSALATSGIGEVDFWPSLPRLVALEEFGDLTRKPRLATGRRPSVALSALSGGRLARSRRWRECLHPYGIGDELMTACRDRHGCWGSVELMREGSDPPFDEQDMRLLTDVAPVLGELIRRSLPLRVGADAGDPEHLAPATLILDEDLRPVGRTRTIDAWLAELPPTVPGTLPAAVYEIGARALTPPEARTSLPASVRIPTRTGGWAVIEGGLLEGDGPGRVALTLRPAVAEEVFDLLCRIHDLSPRERQLAALMRDGLSTRQLADALCISPYTVQDHLKSIFAKTGVRSRRELVSNLSGKRTTGLEPATSSLGSLRSTN